MNDEDRVKFEALLLVYNHTVLSNIIQQNTRTWYISMQYTKRKISRSKVSSTRKELDRGSEDTEEV